MSPVRIRSKSLNKLIGLMGAGLLAGWRQTLDLRLWCCAPEVNPYNPRHCGNYIFAAWHESILAFAFHGMPVLRETVVLISLHQDGEYITRIVERLGARVARGSSRRGGRAGLLEMLRSCQNKHLAITPDGPRGPRRQLQQGVIFLASHTGRPIVPAGFGFSNVWRAKSWDQFAVPLPFSSLTCVTGVPIHVPPNVSGASLEYWRKHVEISLLQCCESAERWAAGVSQPEFHKLAA